MAVQARKESLFGLLVKIFGITIAACLLAGAIGFGVASARSVADDEFGLGAATASSQTSVGVLSKDKSEEVESSNNQSNGESKQAKTDLTAPKTRNISVKIDQIDKKLEEERIAAEKAARAAEEAAIAKAQASKSRAANPGLADVDWSIGREAFIEQWSERIDAYLVGSPLSGQGTAFATAAWENGVDPRWSPAISNTESSKGLHCFLPHNAWGWGQSAWSSWEEAINAHVAGLARGYGYTISLGAAQVYCPPNYQNWFNNTLAQMQSI